MNRYDNRIAVYNTHPLWKSFMIDRGLNFIRQHRVATLRYPTAEEIAELHLEPRIWRQGDRLFKIAHEAYGDVTLWWVIAQFNEKPTEAHISLGDVLYIPRPLETVYRLLGTV